MCWDGAAGRRRRRRRSARSSQACKSALQPACHSQLASMARLTPCVAPMCRPSSTAPRSMPARGEGGVATSVMGSTGRNLDFISASHTQVRSSARAGTALVQQPPSPPCTEGRKAKHRSAASSAAMPPAEGRRDRGALSGTLPSLVADSGQHSTAAASGSSPDAPCSTRLRAPTLARALRPSGAARKPAGGGRTARAVERDSVVWRPPGRACMHATSRHFAHPASP